MATETPKDRFLHLYHRGFSDPLYLKQERNYKMDAHKLWTKLLNAEVFDGLLEAEQYRESK